MAPSPFLSSELKKIKKKKRKEIMVYIIFVVIVLLSKQTAAAFYGKPECESQRCGGVHINYPFGLVGTNCSANDEFFGVTCRRHPPSPPHKPTPFLTKFNLEVLYTDMWLSRISVNSPALKACATTNQQVVRWSTSVNLSGSPFWYDGEENVFVSIGCDGNASVYDETGKLSAGCSSGCTRAPAEIDGCDGYYCCQKDLEHYDRSYRVEVSVRKRGSCRTAFLISRMVAEANVTAIAAIMPDSVIPIWLSYEQDEQVAALISVLATCGCFCTCWFCKTRKRRKEVRLRAKYFKGKLAESLFDKEVASKTKLFTIKELKKATNNFNDDRELGRGGQGTVYKGMLTDGQVIAVKKSRSFEESQWQQYINEVILLSQVNHRNVVRLLGCCLEKKLPLLVYEFVPNGALSQYIHNLTDDKLVLTWEMRLRIIYESAGAIAYLHSSSSCPIYHRDIKSTNILLDEKYQAKVSDFGISKSVTIDQTHLTTCVRGTFGYLDPEYFRSSQFSEKSDVYSFGVIIVEILTGQQPIRETTLEEERSLVVYFLAKMDESNLDDILDPIVSVESTEEEVLRVAKLAKRCLHPRGIERPTMNEVVAELGSVRKPSSSMTVTPEQVSLEIQDLSIGRENVEMDNHVECTRSLPVSRVVSAYRSCDEEQFSAFTV